MSDGTKSFSRLPAALVIDAAVAAIGSLNLEIIEFRRQADDERTPNRDGWAGFFLGDGVSEFSGFLPDLSAMRREEKRERIKELQDLATASKDEGQNWIYVTTEDFALLRDHWKN